MKLKCLYIPLLVFIFMFPAAFGAEIISKGQLVQSKKSDVTCEGDKNRDEIAIYGVPYDPQSHYLKEIYLEVKFGGGGSVQIPLDGGYDPKLKLADLNHDGCKDVFITINTGGSGAIVLNDLYSFKNKKIDNLTVPQPVTAVAQFIDGYKASIELLNGKKYIVDLIDRKKDYDRLGLYHDGKLSEPTELMIDPYSSLKIVRMKDRKGFKGIQAVSGAYHADRIGNIISKWNYENGKWQLVKVKFR
ncbi:hypothetical protein [Peribacillus tepidiphilus]|uniref:hypothetical protein n=1 Tax=Peribacillus tepidiphilus TaxID=2652445 RepID=UPI0035B5071B